MLVASVDCLAFLDPNKNQGNPMHGTLEREARPQPRKAGSLPSQLEPSFAVATPLFRASNRETDETYGAVVTVLNSALRVIGGACGLQWVVQKRKSPLTWASFAYCATKEGLLLRLPKYGHGCDAGSWARIQALPDFFPKRGLAETCSSPSKSGSFIAEKQ